MVFQTKERKEVREIIGSGKYGLSNIQRNQNLKWIVNLEDATPTGGVAGEMRKWLPFNWFKIINNSGQTLKFQRNMSDTDISYIYSGQVVTIESEAIHSFILTPTSAAIAVDTVKIEMKRMEMTSDRFAQAVSKNVFTRFFLGLG